MADYLTLRFSAGGGPITRVLSQRIGAVAAGFVHASPITPNHLTLASSACILLASFLYVVLPAGPGSATILVILLQFAYGLDCADGQLARARRQTSAFGGWLDLTMDAIFGTALAFSILSWTLLRSPSLMLPAVVGICALTAGRVVVVYSGKLAAMAATRGDARTTASEPTGAARRIAVLLMDTPVVYLALGVLRDFPLALSAYAAAMGALFMLTSFQIGFRLRTR